jgi:N-acetylmuramic acid 6-phosphate etherase
VTLSAPALAKPIQYRYQIQLLLHLARGAFAGIICPEDRMKTETLDPRYRDLDRWPTELAVDAMLEGQMAAIAAIQSQTRAIAGAADAAAVRLGDTGRLVFVGAGTSGRLAVQDGAELHPTFGWPIERLVFMMAGGTGALTQAYEGAEDDAPAARAEIAAAGVGASDVVIGVAASGRTPFTLAALEHACAAGALTIAIANNVGSALLDAAEHPICAVTGSEVLAGSTRMKAGTAQKAILNMLSTAIMIRRGLVYDGRMVAMRISNVKLMQRGRVMIEEIAGVDADTAVRALGVAENDIRLGVLVALGTSAVEAKVLLDASGGNLRGAGLCLDVDRGGHAALSATRAQPARAYQQRRHRSGRRASLRTHAQRDGGPVARDRAQGDRAARRRRRAVPQAGVGYVRRAAD